MNFYYCQKAYSLIELLVVIGIIGLMIAFGVPAFERYGDQQAFRQKVDEVSILLSQAYNYSKNPERNIKRYWIATNASRNEIALYSCSNVVIDGCVVDGVVPIEPDPAEMVLVKKIEMGDDQIMQNQTSFFCDADEKSPCQITPSGGIISIRDSRVGKAASYSLGVGTSFFKVDYTITDSE